MFSESVGVECEKCKGKTDTEGLRVALREGVVWVVVVVVACGGRGAARALLVGSLVGRGRVGVARVEASKER